MANIQVNNDSGGPVLGLISLLSLAFSFVIERIQNFFSGVTASGIDTIAQAAGHILQDAAYLVGIISGVIGIYRFFKYRHEGK